MIFCRFSVYLRIQYFFSYWQARNENPLDDAESLKLDSGGDIIEIGKKPKSVNEIDAQYMGLMKFSQKGINQVKKIFHNALEVGYLLGKPIETAYMTDLLQATINEGYSVHSVPVSGGWIEIDTVEDLQSEYTLDRVKQII